jgi:hypothetical protein
MTQDDIALFKKTSNDSDDVDANVKALAPKALPPLKAHLGYAET